METDLAGPDDEPDVAPTPGIWINAMLQQYQETVLALMDIVDTSLPATRVKDSIEEAIREAGLGRADSDGLKKVFSLMPECIDDNDLLDDELFMKRLIEQYGDEPWFAQVFLGFLRLFRRRKREPMLLSSLLIACVSSFEAFMSTLFEAYYRARPGALHAVSREQQKEFSLADIQAMTSIDEATEVAIDRRVEGLMFGGNLESWNKFLKEALKVDMSSLAPDWTASREIFERRHVLAHQGGLPGSRYAAFSRTTLGIEADISRSLDPDEAYVRAAIQGLHVLAAVTGASVSSSLEPGNRWAGVALNDACYQALLHNQFIAALHLARSSVRYAKDESERWISSVNEALALKRLGDRQRMIALVGQWDLSASGALFQMAKAALIDDLDSVFSLLPGLIESSQISAENVLEWPLLQEAREDPRMDATRASLQLSLLSARRDGLVYNTTRKKVHRPDCKHVGGSMTVDADPDKWPPGATACAHCLGD